MNALGPFAESDIFPLYGQQSVLQNLILSRQGVLVGLDELTDETSNPAPPLPPPAADPIRPIQWRAVVHLTVNERQNGDIHLPHLTTHGSALVKALANSRRQSLQPDTLPVSVLIQGSTSRVEWAKSGPFPLILYSDRHNGQRTFVVESIHPSHPKQSFQFLRSQYLLQWMAKAKMNQPRDIAWYLDKYVEEYPFSVVVEGVTGCNLPADSSHIRKTLISLLMLKHARERINRDKLLSNEALLELLSECLELQEIGLIHKEDEAATMPAEAEARILPASLGKGRPPSNEKSVAHNRMEDILRNIPIHYFDIPDPPTGGARWLCPEDNCQVRFPAEEAVSLQHDDDQDLMQLRLSVRLHLWKHIEERGLGEYLQMLNAGL